MKEFPFLPEQATRLTGPKLGTYLKDRLSHLSELAGTLADAGWPVQLTISGLAFQSPNSTEGDEEDAEEVKEQLSLLGIQDEFSGSPSRSLNDILDGEDEYCDRTWYEESDQRFRDLSTPICTCCVDDLTEKMAEMEKQYGRRGLMIGSEYERGILHGKLEALRWVLGDDWEDTEEKHLRARAKQVLEVAQLAKQLQDSDWEDEDDSEEDSDE
jgi:hypothetical protein